MKNSWFVAVVFILFNFLWQTSIFAQNWDIDFVRSVNPEHPNSFVMKGLTASVYPVSIAVPVSTFAVGIISKKKEIKVRAYEEIGSLAIAAVLAESLKKTIDRQRPFEKYNDIYPNKRESGESFPSGHATLAFATATTLSLQYKKWYVVVPAYVWAASAGFSRLYLGEHYTTDVIGGAIIGAGSAVLSHWLTKKVFK